MSVYKQIEVFANNGTLPHAVIFEGEDRYFASAFYAKCAVCDCQNKPCSVCKDCQKAEKQVHPDIINLYPSGDKKGYPIDMIRKIKEDAYVLPNEARAKVYIFNDVDNISTISQNALLKILEEPPKSVLFVLNCKSKAHLLDTIISRATCFYASSSKTDEEVDLYDALELIKTAVFESELELLLKINNFPKERENIIANVNSLQLVLRELYKQKIGVADGDEYADVAENLTVNKILNAIDICEEVRISMLKNKAVKITLVKFCAKLKVCLGR